MRGERGQAAPVVGAAADSLLKLRSTSPELAEAVSKLVVAVADEAARTPRFANALTAAVTSSSPREAGLKRTGRRAPGVIDPFAVYGEIGESGLRSRLSELDLEQLRDIVAEQGMDHDRLAMKWKNPDRVIDRIVDKVSARTAKGSAFRSTSA